MKIKKPKFWDARIGLLAILLIPVTLMIYVLIFFKKKFSKTINFNIPIICVGNIYIGGTGKTPLSILISNEIIETCSIDYVDHHVRDLEGLYDLLKTNESFHLFS